MGSLTDRFTSFKNKFIAEAENKDLTDEQREKLEDTEAEFENKIESIMSKKAEKRASFEDLSPEEKAAKKEAFKEKR